MKKLTALLLAALAAALLLGGCGTIKESDMPYADGMAENLLQGIAKGDYAMFSRDFGGELKAAIDEAAFAAMLEQFAGTIGVYEGKAFAQAADTAQNDVEYTVVVYKARFSEEEGDVLVTISFGGGDDGRTVEGLFFTSPKLRGE